MIQFYLVGFLAFSHLVNICHSSLIIHGDNCERHPKGVKTNKYNHLLALKKPLRRLIMERQQIETWNHLRT